MLKTLNFQKVFIAVLIWEKDVPEADQSRNREVEKLLSDNGMCEVLPKDQLPRSGLWVNKNSRFVTMC